MTSLTVPVESPDDERSWVEMHREWVSRTRQQGTLHPVRDAMPKFLGVIISAFINRSRQQPPGLLDRVYLMQGVAIDLPARNIEHWMNQIWNATYNMVRTNMVRGRSASQCPARRIPAVDY